MNCIVDFGEQFSRLTLSEHPNSLFASFAEASHRHSVVAVRPSEFDSSQTASRNSGRKPVQHSRSSSSGFSRAEIASETVRQTCSTDEAKCELSGPKVFGKREHSSDASQLFDTVSSDSAVQQKSVETSIPPFVRSWAAVLTSGKTCQQLAPAPTARGSQSNQSKLSKSLSTAKNTSVNHAVEFESITMVPARANKSASRSATRDSGRSQYVSSDRCREGSKANDRMPGKQSQSSAADRRSKSRSQTPRPHSDASVHMADLTGKLKPAERGGISAAAAAASSSQLNAMKQNKKNKKKKKSNRPETAVEETSTSDVAESREAAVLTQLAPEFHDLNEFPSLLSVKTTGSKKTSSLQVSSSHPAANSTHAASGTSILSLQSWPY